MHVILVVVIGMHHLCSTKENDSFILSLYNQCKKIGIWDYKITDNPSYISDVQKFGKLLNVTITVRDLKSIWLCVRSLGTSYSLDPAYCQSAQTGVQSNFLYHLFGMFTFWLMSNVVNQHGKFLCNSSFQLCMYILPLEMFCFQVFSILGLFHVYLFSLCFELWRPSKKLCATCTRV